MNDLVSVIIPLHNNEKYLDYCLCSLENQKYSNIEIIIIDDGSIDKGLEIALDHSKKDDRVKVYSYENQGVSFARNMGLKIAKGNYIVFVDSDDYVTVDYISDMIKNIETASMVICAHQILKENKTKNIVHFKKNKITQFNSPYLNICLNDEIWNVVWNKMYIKSIIDSYDLHFDESVFVGEDLIFNISYIKYINKCIYISKPNYIYRINPKSVMNNLDNYSEFLKNIKLQTKLLDLKNNNLNDSKINILIKGYIFIYTFRIKLYAKKFDYLSNKLSLVSLFFEIFLHREISLLGKYFCLKNILSYFYFHKIKI